MPFVQAGTAAIGRIRIRNSQGTPPAGPQPHPQTPQRVTRDAFKGGCPPKPRRLAPRPRPRKELRAKTLNAKGIEPETPFRTPDPPKTRDADQRHAKGRRQTHMGPSAAFLLCGRRESPRKRKGALSGPPLQVPYVAPLRPEPAQRAPGAGGALVSHRVAPAVPSALAGLTSGFGMGPGVPRPPLPPAPGGRCGAGCIGAGWRSKAPWGPHSA